MLSTGRILVIATILTAASATAPASAAAAPITAVEAIALAQERFEGEPIDVERDGPKHHEPFGEVYEVKLLTETGDVIEVRFDIAGGRYLGAEGDDISRARKPVMGDTGAPR